MHDMRTFVVLILSRSSNYVRNKYDNSSPVAIEQSNFECVKMAVLLYVRLFVPPKHISKNTFHKAKHLFFFITVLTWYIFIRSYSVTLLFLTCSKSFKTQRVFYPNALMARYRFPQHFLTLDIQLINCNWARLPTDLIWWLCGHNASLALY